MKKTFTIGSTEYTVCECTAIAKDSGMEKEMEKKIEFCGNAAVIHSLNDLPKIGETKMYLGNKMICISVEIERFTDDDYIVYVAKYCETDSLAMLDEFEMDCSKWLFAIKCSDLIEPK